MCGLSRSSWIAPSSSGDRHLDRDELRGRSEETQCDVLVKPEFLCESGQVDRLLRHMITPNRGSVRSCLSSTRTAPSTPSKLKSALDHGFSMVSSVSYSPVRCRLITNRSPAFACLCDFRCLLRACPHAASDRGQRPEPKPSEELSEPNPYPGRSAASTSAASASRSPATGSWVSTFRPLTTSAYLSA